jgi:hypothetical protein
MIALSSAPTHATTSSIDTTFPATIARRPSSSRNNRNVNMCSYDIAAGVCHIWVLYARSATASILQGAVFQKPASSITLNPSSALVAHPLRASAFHLTACGSGELYPHAR